jgi:putative transposase
LDGWLKQVGARYRIEIVSRPAGSKGFVKLPRRWVVERTFGWLGRYRRLSKDYERWTGTSEVMIQMAMIHIMVRRLEPTYQYPLASQNQGVVASQAA